MAISEDGRVWATCFNSLKVFIYKQNLVIAHVIDMGPVIKTINRRVVLKLHTWRSNKVIIFDRISGVGFLMHRLKIVLTFKENLDWLVHQRVSGNDLFFTAIQHGNDMSSFISYDIQRREIQREGSIYKTNFL